MVINPPLLIVSGLFFLALSSVLYVTTFLAAIAVLRVGRRRISHTRAKQVLLAALLLPPILAAVPTFSGVTFHHSHARPLLEHHNAACSELFTGLLAANHMGGSEIVRLSGMFVNGFAWLLVALGLVFLMRLIVATVRLERGLTPHLSRPSTRLARALAHIGRRSQVNAAQFYECPIPASYSSVLGVTRTRCVLSKELIAAATDDELDAIVAHESAHLRLRDVEATFLVSILTCLFFYLRPVHLLARRWREETELACDADAITVTGNPLAMATAILRVSGTPPSTVLSRPLPAVSLAFADESAGLTARRVENLISQAQKSASRGLVETRLHTVGSWALTLTLAGLGIMFLLSPQAVCWAHCSLEAVAHYLP
jgi:beta-lactamase regulating signal transducer with metallopeptidase domain